MKKMFKSEKGFTLVELMVVIAIIVILAAVLIPRMGFMKQGARESGIQANMRIVQSQAAAIIERQPPTAAGIQAFETAMNTRLTGQLLNPFTNSAAIVIAAPAAAANAPAVFFNNASALNVDEYNGLAANVGLTGAVAFSAYVDPATGRLVCRIWSYDGAGTITPLNETILVQ